jgi:hypothetical protein
MLFKELIAAKFEVFTAMLTKIQLYWDNTNPEDGLSKHLRNVIKYLPIDKASYPSRTKSPK